MPGIPPVIGGLHQDAISTKFSGATGKSGWTGQGTRQHGEHHPGDGNSSIKTLLDPNQAWARATSPELQNTVYYIPETQDLAGTQKYILKNGAAFGTANSLYYVDYDGVDDYMTSSTQDEYDIGGFDTLGYSWMFGGWFSIDESSGPLFSAGDNSKTTGISIEISGGTLISKSGGVSTSWTHQGLNSKWNFIVFSHDETYKTDRLYVNGLLEDERSNVLIANESDPVDIARAKTGTVVPVSGSGGNELHYTIIARLGGAGSSDASTTWAAIDGTFPDMDLYLSTPVTCGGYHEPLYYSNTQVDGDRLDGGKWRLDYPVDAHPVCSTEPLGPESVESHTGGDPYQMGYGKPISGFDDNRDFKVWYNQYASCADEAGSSHFSFLFRVENIHPTNSLTVNGDTLLPGYVWNYTSPFAYDGYGTGEVSDFGGGTLFEIRGGQWCGTTETAEPSGAYDYWQGRSGHIIHWDWVGNQNQPMNTYYASHDFLGSKLYGDSYDA